MSPELQVLLLAIAPISELRGAIPTGLTVLNLPFLKVFLISFFGNLIPVVFLLLTLKPLSTFLSRKSKIFRKFFGWLFSRTKTNIKPWIERYESLALMLFVAIPLPMTGGWTGAIAAFLFDIPFSRAFVLISFGVLIAGGIVSALTIGGIAVGKLFGWQALIISLLFILFCWAGYTILKGKNKK